MSDSLKTVDALEERKEIIQDVIDRLLSNPDYKAALLKLNEQFPSKNFNRRLEASRPNNVFQEIGG